MKCLIDFVFLLQCFAISMKLFASAVFRCVLVFVFFVFFSGCVSSSRHLYVATTPDIYPPKDKKQQIPLLGKKPEIPFRVIGKFQWETLHGWGFIRKCLEYNARINGADAVILHERTFRTETTYTNVPPRVDMIPYTQYVPVSCKGKKNQNTEFVPVVSYVPVFVPGYIRPNIYQWTGVDAEMVVFPGTKPIGKLPPL